MLDDEIAEHEPQPVMRLLRLKDVMDRVGLGRSTIYRWMDGGKFPRPHSLGVHCIRWLEQDIEDWISEKLNN